MIATILTVWLLSAAQAAPQAMPAMDHHAVACAATPAAPPAGLEGWTASRSINAGATAARAPALTVGTGFVATLLPTPKVGYRVRPEKPGGSVSHGGIFTVTIATPGRYRVAMGSGPWIDLLSGTTSLVSVAHGHGPDCTGIRKMVDFDLEPGRYLLQIAGNGTPTLPLMVARVP